MHVKFRHRIVFKIIPAFFRIYLKFKYNLKVYRYKTKKQPYLILSNHTCSLDPFIVSCLIKQPIYFMANEDLFSNGFASSLIKYLAAPIPKSKSMKDLQAVKTCIRIKKEGGSIGIFPEGNRTYSGLTCTIDKSISKLAKKLNIPILLVNIEGGFQTDPRFSDFIRKGKMGVRVIKEISVDELNNIDEDNLYDVIVSNLDVKLTENVKFKSKKKAMYLERVMYYCFNCNSYQTFSSKGNYIKCSCCDYTLKYTEYCNFEIIKGNHKVNNLADYYIQQEDLLKSKSLEDLKELYYSDENVTLSTVKRFEKREVISTFKLEFKDYKLILDNHVFDFKNIIAMTCLGKNKINIYLDNNTTLQFKGEKSFCALKYLQVFYYYKHITNIGEKDDNRIFMGL